MLYELEKTRYERSGTEFLELFNLKNHKIIDISID